MGVPIPRTSQGSLRMHPRLSSQQVLASLTSWPPFLSIFIFHPPTPISLSPSSQEGTPSGSVAPGLPFQALGRSLGLSPTMCWLCDLGLVTWMLWASVSSSEMGLTDPVSAQSQPLASHLLTVKAATLRLL